MIQKKVPQWKLDEINKLIELFKDYKNVAIVRVAGIHDRQIQDMRKKLRGDAVLKMAKKNLQTRAIEQYEEESDKDGLDALKENIPGQAMFVFTDMDVFELKKIFEENSEMIPAKPGEPAPVDIWVTAGDTGLPTGQVISELNMTLKLPTKIQNDTIWIRDDTKTHEQGEVVTIKQAAVLKKLGVKPVESVIKIQYAWSDGDAIPQDVLYMDREAFVQDLATCVARAQTLAVELGIVDVETLRPLIRRGYREGLALLFELPIFDERMTDEYLKKAAASAAALNALVFGGGQPAAKTKTKEAPKKEEPEEEDEEEEEEEDVGLGGLF